ncbi:hypothetical protein E9993_08395 [Labilibacter sediminis]|nr:hypothetical protein E9993_08395 [Labilibacter sediminis]
MKKKMIKSLITAFAIGLLAAFTIYLYVFHKPHRDVAGEKPAYKTTASKLIDEFTADETTAYNTYGNQVIQVTGEVAEISISSTNVSISLEDAMSGVSCGFDSLSIAKVGIHKLQEINEGDQVIIKGQCDGYDMIMGVVLTRCFLIK